MPKARACLDEIKVTRAPAQIYELMISDESPFPESPGSGVTVDDDPEITLTNAFEAYRAELESGAKVIQMRQVFKRLQGV